MAMISIKQLRYFDAVARLGHFGKAADHCAVSQPALSMQIQEMERELAIKLVERRPPGAVLTEAGREVARRASRILGEVRDLKDYARHFSTPLSGPLHLGIIPTIAPYVLPPLLPRAPRQPRRAGARDTHRDPGRRAADGILDLLLLALPVDQPDIVTHRLFEDRFLLAVPAGRKLGRRISEPLDLVKHDRLLLLEEGHCLRDQALEVCRLRQVDNLDTFGASSLSTIVQMVAGGLGVTLLPEISLPVERMHGRIEVKRFDEPQPSRTIGLAWRATSPRAEEFRTLAPTIAVALGDL